MLFYGNKGEEVLSDINFKLNQVKCSGFGPTGSNLPLVQLILDFMTLQRKRFVGGHDVREYRFRPSSKRIYKVR